MSHTIRRIHQNRSCRMFTSRNDSFSLPWQFHRDKARGIFNVPRFFRRVYNKSWVMRYKKSMHRALSTDTLDDFSVEPQIKDAAWFWW